MKQKHTSRPKVVVIGGGTGVFTVLTGLKNYPIELSAIISMSDDGGSTGVLREEFGILPTGDVRRALVALAHSNNRMLADLFNYRFNEGRFRGHAFGNIMLTALERLTGNFESALDEAAKLLGARGRVIPVTLDNTKLCALYEDGRKVMGETNIDIPAHSPELKIKKVYLDPPAKSNRRALEAIREAHLVVLGPGDLYTSIIPNLLVKGISNALKTSKAQKAYIVSTMTKPGETSGFSASDFLETIESYLGTRVLHTIIVNTKRPAPERMKQYEAEGKKLVQKGNLPRRPTPIFGDFIRQSGFVRHDPEKLARVLVSLL